MPPRKGSKTLDNAIYGDVEFRCPERYDKTSCRKLSLCVENPSRIYPVKNWSTGIVRMPSPTKHMQQLRANSMTQHIHSSPAPRTGITVQVSRSPEGRRDRRNKSSS